MPIEPRLDIEKSINRSPHELDLEHVQLPAVTDAGDIGRRHRLTFYAGPDHLIEVGQNGAGEKKRAQEEDGGSDTISSRLPF